MKRFVISVILISISSLTSQAATMGPRPGSECKVDLTGPIEEGDFDRFANMARSIGFVNLERSEPDHGKNSVCLNSSGGSYRDGLLIADFIHSNGIGTRIPAGSRCMSACATIFMAGRIQGVENDGPYRYLHVRGQLGFHAPFLRLKEAEMWSGNRVEKLVDEINRLTSITIKLFSYKSVFSSNPLIRSSLIQLMYDTPPEKIFLIDTVGKAIRWDIDLYGNRELTNPRPINYVHACINLSARIRDEEPEPVTDADLSSYAPNGKLRIVGKFVHIDTGGMAERFCRIAFEKNYFSMCYVDDFSGVHHGRCPNAPHIEASLIGYPWSTPLGSIAGR